MHPVRIGICGLGRWGTSYLKTLSATPGCRVAAIADNNPALLDSAARDAAIRVFPSLDAMLAESQVSAVVLATPDHTHYPLARAALEAGRDVMVEKPMTRTAGQAEELVNVADSSELVLAAGHTALYHPGHADLRRALGQGTLGRPLAVQATRTSSGPALDPAAGPPALAVLWDLAPHDLALIISLFGPPAACRMACASPGLARAECELLFPDELRARCVAAWQPAPHRRTLHLVGSAASLTVDEQRLPPDQAQHPLARQCLDFVECCRVRRVPLSSSRLGLAVVRSLEAVVQSSLDAGRWIPLPRAEAQVPESKIQSCQPHQP